MKLWRTPALMLVLGSIAVSVVAQTSDKPADVPDAPAPQKSIVKPATLLETYLFLAPGALVAPAGVNAALATGAGIDAGVLRTELGYLHQSGARAGNAGEFTVGFAGPRAGTIGPNLSPYAVLAYTRLFGGLIPGNALTLGAGLDWYYKVFAAVRSEVSAIRVEALDMIQPGAPCGAQHTVQLRIGWVLGGNP